jgi:MoaA/NifB/PqqE/SkfB family radical SAM enzyme
MIGISKLYCGTVEASDPLRYGRHSGKLPSHLLQFSKDKKPVVVWNVGRRCNLRCIHCYSQSQDIDYEDELTTVEGKALIDDLAKYGSPVLLFSGGEPLMREDILELIGHAKSKGMRAVLSTNGTLITRELAKQLKELDLSYVGISLDGLQKTHDMFRGKKGAFDEAIQGLRNCQEAGIKVGLRFTMNKKNVEDIPGIFQLLRDEDIPRACFYHLVYTGRGSKIIDEDLTKEETRKTVDLLMDLTREMYDEGLKNFDCRQSCGRSLPLSAS